MSEETEEPKGYRHHYRPPSPRPPRPPVPRPPGWPDRDDKWETPPRAWLIKHGFMLQARRKGWPVEAEIGFKENPHHPHMPRLPWPYESESRPPGTGMVMGRLPKRHRMQVIYVEVE